MAEHALHNEKETEPRQPELACMPDPAELGIGPGGEVIVPPHTFIAASFSAYQTGAV